MFFFILISFALSQTIVPLVKWDWEDDTSKCDEIDLDPYYDGDLDHCKNVIYITAFRPNGTVPAGTSYTWQFRTGDYSRTSERGTALFVAKEDACSGMTMVLKRHKKSKTHSANEVFERYICTRGGTVELTIEGDVNDDCYYEGKVRIEADYGDCNKTSIGWIILWVSLGVVVCCCCVCALCCYMSSYFCFAKPNKDTTSFTPTAPGETEMGV